MPYEIDIPEFNTHIFMPCGWEECCVPEIDGNRFDVIQWINSQSGPFGHQLYFRSLRPADLHFALVYRNIEFNLIGEIKDYALPPEGERF